MASSLCLLSIQPPLLFLLVLRLVSFVSANALTTPRPASMCSSVRYCPDPVFSIDRQEQSKLPTTFHTTVCTYYTVCNMSESASPTATEACSDSTTSSDDVTTTSPFWELSSSFSWSLSSSASSPDCSSSDWPMLPTLSPSWLPLSSSSSSSSSLPSDSYSFGSPAPVYSHSVPRPPCAE
ncbi:hypothetical protein SCUCBS95973_002249 [Sporothrix curviconia]|uniref:Uncharacterized protein n=1 Tax=Sporothrix curviconia TaxID=1260050 RepID=A0ABP0B5H7_9PEZI